MESIKELIKKQMNGETVDLQEQIQQTQQDKETKSNTELN